VFRCGSSGLRLVHQPRERADLHGSARWLFSNTENDWCCSCTLLRLHEGFSVGKYKAKTVDALQNVGSADDRLLVMLNRDDRDTFAASPPLHQMCIPGVRRRTWRSAGFSDTQSRLAYFLGEDLLTNLPRSFATHGSNVTVELMTVETLWLWEILNTVVYPWSAVLAAARPCDALVIIDIPRELWPPLLAAPGCQRIGRSHGIKRSVPVSFYTIILDRLRAAWSALPILGFDILDYTPESQPFDLYMSPMVRMLTFAFELRVDDYVGWIGIHTPFWIGADDTVREYCRSADGDPRFRKPKPSGSWSELMALYPDIVKRAELSVGRTSEPAVESAIQLNLFASSDSRVGSYLIGNGPAPEHSGAGPLPIDHVDESVMTNPST
jgi:hypothetical protein